MIGIYAGRFQPFHLGHFEAIEYILNKCDETFICICSKKGDNPLDDRNSFTYEERRNMMVYFKRKVHFRHICDQESDEEWARVIEKEMPKGRKVSFTNNPKTRKAFQNHKYEVNPIPVKHDGLSATTIRKLIIRNEKWDHLVPQGTMTVIEEIRNV
ncbi:hypothetical protein LCGC14_2654280 [marine sediment metagenome]|uniref:Cytidyltransferase-like domain-containing protein n=1 Tax=marine sediment metagenome TaxID=412755 RepID=A0A0F9AG65_9ZZZZ